ncbi:MAG: LysM peptidoglycan-binding domain-containing protein [Clostridia bacterium]|nr:LysM peptidoglycan-binding domain-containing protein [Clostridia bacterium]
MKIHSVRENESVYEIGAEYGVSPAIIAEANGIESGGRLTRGFRILLPEPTRTYSVRHGDTLASIAERFSESPEALIARNPALRGGDRLYQGQLLAIKYGGGGYGMCAANGYFYRGCSIERLRRFMPYISFLTVCSARLDRGRVGMLFDDGEVTALARKCGKLTILRVYIAEGEIPSRDKREEIISDIAIMAKSRGFSGITLAGAEASEEFAELTVDMRKRCIECELSLLVECDAERNCRSADYADGAVVSYDKLGRDKIPSFEEGERGSLVAFAEKYDAPRSFVDLSAFGLSGGRYIPKEHILRARERGRGEVIFDPEALIERSSLGKGAPTLIEAIDNTKAKLELVSELGFLGISFDIARAPIRELFLFQCMFGTGAVAVAAQPLR